MISVSLVHGNGYIDAKPWMRFSGVLHLQSERRGRHGLVLRVATHADRMDVLGPHLEAVSDRPEVRADVYLLLAETDIKQTVQRRRLPYSSYFQP
jgi:hypothetical protein